MLKTKAKQKKVFVLNDLYQGMAISLLVDAVCLFLVGLFALRGYFPKVFMLYAFIYLGFLHFITALLVSLFSRQRPDIASGSWLMFWLFPSFFLVLFFALLIGAPIAGVIT